MRQCSENTSVDEMCELLRLSPAGWPDGWAGWRVTQQAHIRLLDAAVKDCPPYPEEKYPEKRGIVISVNAKPGWSSGKNLPNGYFPGAWVVVKELRRLGCTLPIAFAYMGELELDRHLQRIVEPLGVTCIDLLECNRDAPMRILAGWESKICAILNAPFEQVLYLDADSIPVRDPTYLFDSPQFKHFGSIFWPDMPPHDRAEWLPAIVWENIGLPPNPDYVDFESGQVMIDKRKCWKETVATRHINEHSDWYYKFVFGDKSTFHLAWAKCLHMQLNHGWAMPSHHCGWNGKHIEQYDFGSKLLFQHATQDKPSLAGFGHPHHLIHREQCESHLAELRDLWDGTLWINLAPNDAEKTRMNELMRGLWNYERIGRDKRIIRFLEDNRIGRGFAKCEVAWSVFETNRGPKLIVSGIEGRPTFWAIRHESGCWHGAWLEHERCPVSISPVQEVKPEAVAATPEPSLTGTK